jgi:predicted aspartyl protease
MFAFLRLRRTLGPLLVAVSVGLCAPAAAAQRCPPLKRIASIDLKYDYSGRPVVPVLLNGRSKHLLVDTGAYISGLSRRAFDELGIPLKPARFQLRHSATGFTEREFGRVQEFRIGNLRAADHPFFLSPAPRNDETAVEGEFGSEVLRNYDLDFDFVAGKLNLFDAKHCAAQVIYWRPAAVAVVPFDGRDGDIVFTAKVDGQEVKAILDTGATWTYMNLAVAQRRYAIDATKLPRAGTVDGVTRADFYKKRFSRLELDGLAVLNPEIILWPEMGTPRRVPLFANPDDYALFPPLIIGMSVMSKLHVYIAYKEGKVYFTTPGADEAPFSNAAP